MTKFSIHKISIAAFSGVAVLMLVASVTAPADAAIGRSKFRATPEELRRHCWRIDETFWLSKRRYGCGEQVSCESGKCRGTPLPPPPPPPQSTPIPFKGDGGNGNGGSRGAGAGGSGGQSSGSASGPN